MMSTLPCPMCGGTDYLPSGDPCQCLEQRRVRQHIDSYDDLEGAKPLESDVPLEDARVHGEWSLVRRLVAYHVGRAYLMRRPLVTWMTSSSAVRSLYLGAKGELPRALEGKTFVVVRVSNLDNRLVGTALHELTALCQGRAPVWLVTSPPEKPLETGHRAWNKEFGLVIDAGFPAFDFSASVSPKTEPVMPTRPDSLELIGKGGAP
jgi:hypothetical protein